MTTMAMVRVIIMVMLLMLIMAIVIIMAVQCKVMIYSTYRCMNPGSRRCCSKLGLAWRYLGLYNIPAPQSLVFSVEDDDQKYNDNAIMMAKPRQEPKLNTSSTEVVLQPSTIQPGMRTRPFQYQSCTTTNHRTSSEAFPVLKLY